LRARRGDQNRDDNLSEVTIVLEIRMCIAHLASKCAAEGRAPTRGFAQSRNGETQSGQVAGHQVRSLKGDAAHRIANTIAKNHGMSERDDEDWLRDDR
jgi:hypothetical protein